MVFCNDLNELKYVKHVHYTPLKGEVKLFGPIKQVQCLFNKNF